jgi:hypothetical protein
MNTIENLNVFVPEKDLSDFLNFTLNESAITHIKKFLKTLYNKNLISSYVENKFDSNGINYAEYFKPILFLLYYEIISYQDLDSIVVSYSYNDILDACKRILGLNDTSAKLKKTVFIRNKIRNIYTHRNDIISYKNLANVQDIFNTIYLDLTSEEKRWLHRLPGFIAPRYDSTDPVKILSYGNFYKYFYRINGQEAIIEQCLPFFSLIYNEYELDPSSINHPEGFFIQQHFMNIDNSKNINLEFLTSAYSTDGSGNLVDIDLYDVVKRKDTAEEDREYSVIYAEIVDFFNSSYNHSLGENETNDPNISCLEALESIFLKISTRTINYE